VVFLTFFPQIFINTALFLLFLYTPGHNYHMKRYLLIAVFCISAILSFGQTRKIDSLKRTTRYAAGDQAKLNAVIGLCGESDVLPVDTLWKYAAIAKTLSQKLGDKQSYSLAIIAQADAYLKWDNIDSAKAIVEPELLKYNVDDPALRDIYFKLEEKKISCKAIIIKAASTRYIK